MTRRGRAKALVATAALGGAGIVAVLAVRSQRLGVPLWRMGHDGMLSLQALMAANWLAFGIGQTLVAASGVLPASMIALMAGATFGLGWGLLISVLSTMFGGWIAFALSRSALRGWITRHLARRPAILRLDDVMTAEGWRLVLLLRVSPVMPFALTSFGLGLTRISQRNFLLGTLASLPALAGYVTLGALGKQGLLLAGSDASLWHWLPIAGGIALVLYALLRVRKALVRLGADAPACAVLDALEEDEALLGTPFTR